MPSTKRPRVYLGIDPGFAITGYGIIETNGARLKLIACGAITTPAHTLFGRRLQTIYRELQKLIRRFQPDEIGIEQLFFAKNTTTALQVAHARGIAVLAAAEQGCPVREFTPLQVKQALTGYGRATKQQVEKMIKLMLALKTAPRPDDVSDALAIAICCSQTKKFE